MTVVDLEVELEVSLSQILLVVAKYRVSVDEPDSVYEMIGVEESLHWTEVGGGVCGRAGVSGPVRGAAGGAAGGPLPTLGPRQRPVGWRCRGPWLGCGSGFGSDGAVGWRVRARVWLGVRARG